MGCSAICNELSRKTGKSQLEGEGAKFAHNSNKCSLTWNTGTGNWNFQPEVELSQYSSTKTLLE